MAFAALDAVWQQNRTESLAILLGGMAIVRTDGDSMNPGCLHDWNKVMAAGEGLDELGLLLAYLDLDARRYRNVPDDLRRLISALRTEGSAERGIVDAVIATWHEDPESWPLYAKLTRPSED